MPKQVQTIFPEHNARYVRILCQTRATPWGCSINELQVHARAVGVIWGSTYFSAASRARDYAFSLGFRVLGLRGFAGSSFAPGR